MLIHQVYDYDDDNNDDDVDGRGNEDDGDDDSDGEYKTIIWLWTAYHSLKCISKELPFNRKELRNKYNRMSDFYKF